MGSRIRCPHCEEMFFAMGTAATVACPACAESVPNPRAAGGSGAAPGPGAPSSTPGAPVPAASKGRGKFNVLRTCSSCGTEFPGEKNFCPSCGTSFRMAKTVRREAEQGDYFRHEKAGIRKGVKGGLAMLAIAAVWFFGGLAAGIVFYYPIVLAVIGVYAVIKGLATGNLSGETTAPRAGRRRARAEGDSDGDDTGFDPGAASDL